MNVVLIVSQSYLISIVQEAMTFNHRIVNQSQKQNHKKWHKRHKSQREQQQLPRVQLGH